MAGSPNEASHSLFHAGWHGTTCSDRSDFPPPGTLIWRQAPGQQGTRVVHATAPHHLRPRYPAPGVIGTNKADAAATAALMREDLEAGVGLGGGRLRGEGDLAELLRGRGVGWVDEEGSGRLDAVETARGKAEGRPRVKFCTVEEMLEGAGVGGGRVTAEAPGKPA